MHVTRPGEVDDIAAVATFSPLTPAISPVR